MCLISIFQTHKKLKAAVLELKEVKAEALHQRIIIARKNNAINFERSALHAATVGVQTLETTIACLRRTNSELRECCRDWRWKFINEEAKTMDLATHLANKEVMAKNVTAQLVNLVAQNGPPPNICGMYCVSCTEYFKPGEMGFTFKCQCTYFNFQHKKCIVDYIGKFKRWECAICREPFCSEMYSSATIYSAITTEAKSRCGNPAENVSIELFEQPCTSSISHVINQIDNSTKEIIMAPAAVEPEEIDEVL